MVHSKNVQLTISAAGMVCNWVKEFQRGSSDGKMKNTKGRRINRVKRGSLRWRGRNDQQLDERAVSTSTHLKTLQQRESRRQNGNQHDGVGRNRSEGGILPPRGIFPNIKHRVRSGSEQ